MPRAEILKINEVQYHADLDGPSLSSSIAKKLLTESPLHAWAAHPRLGNMPFESTREQHVGSVMHRLVLGAGPEIAWLPFKTWQSNDAKAAKATAELAGMQPEKMENRGEYFAWRDAINRQLLERGIVLRGKSEVAIAFEESVGDKVVKCRSMVDHLDGYDIYDLKSCASAELHACESAAARYSYHLQAAVYTRAVTQLLDAPPGRVSFQFIWCEKNPPYAIRVMRPDPAFMMAGDDEWGRALSIWEECLRTNKWPGYEDCALSLPSWKSPREGAMEESHGYDH